MLALLAEGKLASEAALVPVFEAEFALGSVGMEGKATSLALGGDDRSPSSRRRSSANGRSGLTAAV